MVALCRKERNKRHNIVSIFKVEFFCARKVHKGEGRMEISAWYFMTSSTTYAFSAYHENVKTEEYKTFYVALQILSSDDNTRKCTLQHYKQFIVPFSIG